MAKGLPKWAIKEAKARGAKNIFAYAWTLVKRKERKGSQKSNPKKTKRRGGFRMSKKKRRYNRNITIPLAPIAGLAAGMSTAIVDGAMKGNWELFFNELCRNYTGYNPYDQTWNVFSLKKGLLPLVIGLLVHKFVGGSPLNLNRTLARHKIPFIRI